jgi:hypothetical protein
VSGGSILFTTFGASGDCPAEFTDQDSYVVTVLGDGFTATVLGGKMFLTSQGDEELFYAVTDEAPAERGAAEGLSLDDLAGTTWTLFEGLVGDTELPTDDTVQLAFTGDGARAGDTCASFDADVTVVDGAIGWSDAYASTNCEDIVERFLQALTRTTAISAFHGEQPRVLELFGPDIQLVLLEATPGAGESMTVDELLDVGPRGEVTLDGNLVTYGNTAIVCGASARLSDPRLCSRWVALTNYIQAVDGDGPFTGVLRADGRFQIVGPGSGVEQRGSGVDLTEADRAILEPFLGLQGLDGDVMTGLGADLSPTVGLWLGTTLSLDRTDSDLADADNWVFDVDDFDGFAGPFSVLDTLGDQGDSVDGDAFEVLVGPHDHCAGQPLVLPGSVQGLRQLSIQPTGIDSCLQWFAVDLFVNGEGQIEAVMLDFFGP